MTYIVDPEHGIVTFNAWEIHNPTCEGSPTTEHIEGWLCTEAVNKAQCGNPAIVSCTNFCCTTTFTFTGFVNVMAAWCEEHDPRTK